jgi:protein-tyrosine phosphatase
MWLLKRKAATQLQDLEAEFEAADYRVLFVCMGNICRSPTAEGAFCRAIESKLADATVIVDSAGTHAYHVGSPPDPRSQRAALRRGIDISGLRARRIAPQDFSRFDMIVAMDPLNRAVLLDSCPAEQADRIHLFLEFAPEIEREDVPDPYYGGANGFEYVLDLAEEAAAGLADYINDALGARS